MIKSSLITLIAGATSLGMTSYVLYSGGEIVVETQIENAVRNATGELAAEREAIEEKLEKALAGGDKSYQELLKEKEDADKLCANNAQKQTHEAAKIIAVNKELEEAIAIKDAAYQNLLNKQREEARACKTVIDDRARKIAALTEENRRLREQLKQLEGTVAQQNTTCNNALNDARRKLKICEDKLENQDTASLARIKRLEAQLADSKKRLAAALEQAAKYKAELVRIQRELNARNATYKKLAEELAACKKNCYRVQ